jgi:hypothetical protein
LIFSSPALPIRKLSEISFIPDIAAAGEEKSP